MRNKIRTYIDNTVSDKEDIVISQYHAKSDGKERDIGFFYCPYVPLEKHYVLPNYRYMPASDHMMKESLNPTWKVIDCKKGVSEWIETQPQDMWVKIDTYPTYPCTYAISEKLESWLILRYR